MAKKNSALCRFGKSALGFMFLGLVFFPGCTGLSGLSGLTKNRTVFVYKAPAGQVCVSGDFNGWSRDTDCLERHGGTWTLDMIIPPGRYAYAFYLDGNRFIPDPGALFFEDDGFGNINSVLVVP